MMSPHPLMARSLMALLLFSNFTARAAKTDVPATGSGESSTYSYAGCSFDYPVSWKIRPATARAASILHPSGESFSALWDFDQRPAGRIRSTEGFRDAVVNGLKGKAGYQVKEQGALKLADGRKGAFF